MGVATGLVQEFQFGMAWSAYSRFVGDVFGAPLAMEGLLAFFFESTFLGVWIFGWNLLPKRIHLAALCLAIMGSVASAYFILVANAWMQHPVGVVLHNGRPELVDIWAVLGNNTAVQSFTHTLTASFCVGAAFLVGLSWYHLWARRRDGLDTVDSTGRVVVGRSASDPSRDEKDHSVWLTSLRVGAVVAIVAFAGVAFTGDLQAKLMFQQQPMKMASAEAACKDGTGFSVLSIGDVASPSCSNVVSVIEVPGLLSFLAKGDTTTTVNGVETLLPKYAAKYGTNYPNDPALGQYAGKKIDYEPNMTVTYWGFRFMIGFGILAAGAAALALLLTRKGTVPRPRWLMRLAVLSILSPFVASSFGWIFTEMGRQPFVVAPNPGVDGIDGVYMYTVDALTPGITSGELLFSVISLTAVYGFLMVFEIRLLMKFARGGIAGVLPERDWGAPGPSDDPGAGSDSPAAEPSMALVY